MPTAIVLIAAIVVIVIAVGAVVLLSNPTVTTTTTTNITTSTNSTTVTGPSTVPYTYAFNLTNLHNVGVLTDSDGIDFAAIEINYTTNIENIEFANSTLIDPKGRVYTNRSYTPASLAPNTTFFILAPSFTTPLPGRYTMNLSYNGQKLFGRSLTFNGANAVVVGVTYNTTDSFLPNPNNQKGNESYLHSVNITLYNSGDLPTYVSDIDVNISSSSVSHIMTVSPLRGWILPHRYTHTGAATAYAFPSGTYTIYVYLLNASNDSLGAGSFIIQIPKH